MLYAATRNTLTKSLGSTHFTDNIFATSKDDLSADAYAKHKRHLAAPQPMSARELEMAAVKAAEREAGGGSYEGSRARRNHVGMPVGHGVLKWSEEVIDALKQLGTEDGSQLLILVSYIVTLVAITNPEFVQTIDPASEVTHVASLSDCAIDQLGSALPPSDPGEFIHEAFDRSMLRLCQCMPSSLGLKVLPHPLDGRLVSLNSLVGEYASYPFQSLSTLVLLRRLSKTAWCIRVAV